MNSKVAEHLTRLLKRSAPIVGDGERKWSHPSLPWTEIRDLILPVEQRHKDAAQAEEIRAAARERREASGYARGIGHESPNAVAWHPGGGYGLILLTMCRPEIDAVIAADNARRLAEYEAYRAACEQGVAVEPQ